MTLFFFSVGLEIRREMQVGELAGLRRAALPAAAALGGMIAPALIYFALNTTGPSARGWAIPTATDIACALAALALLGKRIAPALRILLLALAILDDIGGVIVIALFYADEIVTRWIPLIPIAIVLTLALQRSGVRSAWPYVIPAVVLWCGMHETGVHPTMAGVIMGLLTPPKGDDATGISPSAVIHGRLYPWVALAIMPTFAFFNAGVSLAWPIPEPRIAGGILLGLFVGKPLGIVAATWIAVRLCGARLPDGVEWRGVALVGLVAGVGFTVALFIAALG